MSRNLRIVLVHPPHESDASQRAGALQAGLIEAGYELVASLPADIRLPEQIARLLPDMIIVDAESDARDVLEHIVVATRDERRPIVMFTEDDKTSSMEAALEAGVSAYIVAGLKPERIKPVLNVALARFRKEEKLLHELRDTKHKLAERKVIDRAKGLLMSRHGMSEDQAYQRLRTLAMNKNLKLAEVAQRILDVEDLLG
ncbi:ANTAR domain-containing response regulator [Pseudoduganella plicata]|uniref:ANTAR domain-containing protein n=1 Tax=Pseudoduganella plicata TaxID=321984 RepID=A0A4P7BEG8_9BURK|nr:ANTAR domain-containing protein [Pseudoduganella plicata]QBQ37111.1 ANTAR domain-containing protein [Pseudoduganella plicata]GGY99292.1 transcriptional regulator [Pseudoduganella plicata]